jgi:hypothetical protein
MKMVPLGTITVVEFIWLRSYKEDLTVAISFDSAIES